MKVWFWIRIYEPDPTGLHGARNWLRIGTGSWFYMDPDPTGPRPSQKPDAAGLKVFYKVLVIRLGMG